ncbi:TonB-dependent receptor [Parabacteroides sp. 52]|uniref:TonB-dependent receptor n=1 Tax=unclassified Parabacteroides TaxID=2649774 RepID=UPI0013D2C9A2|nr:MULTISPECIES: TonB-dependent receptor [unclassified Parabacteroides]MDH6535234.1 outer membrane receptor for ferrienterochelin and colicin [Parabacteroides sp. PM5-20]NDV55626.1 TonB-dependent receptor [Parabacteroides sp. 52]
MKRSRCIIFLFFSAFFVCGYAQQKVTVKEANIKPEKLFETIERQSEYRVYCNPAEMDSLVLSVDCTDLLPVDILKKAFENTDFKVSSYGDRYLFVLKGRELMTALSDDYFEKRVVRTTPSDNYILSPLEQKATSENKLYTIGDERKDHMPDKIQLTGVMTDFRTGEPVIGAVIYTEKTMVAATTDAFGFYSLQIPPGRHRLMIRGVGLKDTQRQLAIYDNGKLDIELEEEVYSLKEVVITSERLARVQSTKLGVERMQIKDIKNIPTAFGEVDVIKVVMMLPGVKAVGEASSGFNVRGGSTDQNLILFNDGTIYNPTHLFGFFSAFNPDLVKEIELYKSSIPAKYGGRISSVLEINGREGNKKELTGQVSLGLLTSRATFEGPIGKKTSFILGGRTTYSDWILKKLPEKSGYNNGRAGFYDLNAIVDHKFSERDNLYLSGYYSHDRFNFNEDERYGYSNMNASAKWRHIYNDRLTSTVTGGYDHYSYKTETDEDPIAAYRLNFGINQGFLKLDFTSYLTDKHTLDYGMNGILYILNPGEYAPNADESLVIEDKMQEERALETALYVADRWNLTSKLSLDLGIRYSMFQAMGPRTYNVYDSHALPSLTNVIDTKNVKDWKAFKTYHAPEFRLSARYAFRNDFSVKVGANTLQQYIHKLSNSTIMSPTDTWKLSDANVRPQKGLQLAAGVYKNFLDNTIETSIEGYYKTMKDYLDYRSGAQLIMNHHIETDVMNTQGRAYGVELMVKKTQGKLNGWISYAYSRTQLRQNDSKVEKPINNGNWYAADYDKPHEFKFAGNYKFTQRYSISLNCDYSTGRPITLPTSKYQYTGGEYVFYSERNQYRIPDFFRMDFAINIEPSHHLTLLTHSTISLGVYNLTGRNNAYSVYYVSENGRLEGRMMSIFGSPIPYVSYNIKF